MKGTALVQYDRSMVVLQVLLLVGATGLGAGDLVFPVKGEYQLLEGFGTARGNGRYHQGLDIGAAKMTPVVAAAAGVVQRLQDTPGGPCCSLVLRHDDGWQSRYLHLNDDSPGTDDGREVGLAPGLQADDRVAAGELIGWVGDSGNATTPHLHFELRTPDGSPVDPLPYLARGRTAGWRAPLHRYWRLLVVVLLLAATLLIKHQQTE